MTFLENEFKNRTYNLKKIATSSEIKKVDYMEKFKYINLRHRNEFEFNIDRVGVSKEIYLEDNMVFKEDELKEIPVFNQIAAGNPIEINDEIKESFYLPSGWLERGKDTFILEVKGDSMIDKNIFNGDLVVIKRQHTAYNNDIVAASLDGEATLKILNTNDKYPKLMPANTRYKEISLIDKEVSILGVAIGIIKHN
jgi:SOS regulatory protein LexA